MEPEEKMEQEVLSDTNAVPKRRSHKKKKVSRVVIITILSVFALIIGAGIYVINHYMNKINYIDPATESVMSPSEFKVEDSKYWETADNPNGRTEDTTDADISETDEDTVVKVVRAPFQADAYRATLSADDEQVIFDHPVTPTMSQAGPLHDEDLINIMLVGQDTRNTDYRERSDVMILVSINPKTHKVALISFLRDLYVQIGGDYGWNRLNTAFKIGGLQKMYEVYESVFGLHIDGGIYINFGQFMTLVNMLGGVDVTLTETEAKWLRTTLEQSVPDMRYWGQIVEALMPTIKSGTSVQEAIQTLQGAELGYGWADANGGVAPDNLSKATVKGLYLNAAGTSKAKAGTYYALQRTIYIEYSETRITFPTIPAEASVESVVKLLTGNGFQVAYADKNGNAAPYNSKSALVAGVYREAEGKNSFIPGEKFAYDTVAYIAYTENVATVPTIPEGATVAEAEPLLKAAGLAVSWSALNDGNAPADKTKATVTGIWLDQASTKKLNAGDKLDINATVYLSYEEVVETTEEQKAVMPDIPAGTSVRSAEQALVSAGFTVAYADKNAGNAPDDPDNATVVRITSDAAGTSVISAGNEREMLTTVYITYSNPTPSSSEEPTQCSHTYGEWIRNNDGTHYHVCTKCGEGRVSESCDAYFTETGHQEATCTAPETRTLKCSRCGYEKYEKISEALGHVFENWESDGNGKHYSICSRCGSQSEPAACTLGPDGVCTVCGYRPEPTTEEPTTEEPTTEPMTEEPTTAEPTTEAAETSTTETVTTEETSTEANEEPAPGDGGDAGQSNEGLTGSSNPAAYLTVVPGSEQSNSVSASSKGLYNPIVKPMSTTSAWGSSNDPWYLENIKPGPVHLDGMQALAYCRMRKLDSDIKRTERQRTVLNILFNKVKNANIATLNALLEEILPQVTTDLTKTELLEIAAIVLPYFSSINLQMHSIPAQGTYSFATINKQAVLTMNQAQNIEALRSWLPF